MDCFRKKKSKQNDYERRKQYQCFMVECDICGKTLQRNNLYKHRQNIHNETNDNLEDNDIQLVFNILDRPI